MDTAAHDVTGGLKAGIELRFGGYVWILVN